MSFHSKLIRYLIVLIFGAFLKLSAGQPVNPESTPNLAMLFHGLYNPGSAVFVSELIG